MNDFCTIDRWAEIYPEATALHDLDTNKVYSYRDLSRNAHKLAGFFSHRFNIKRGDRVAWIAHNSVEAIFAFYALRRIGAILVPLNWRLSSRELVALIHDCDPQLIICDTQFVSQFSSLTVVSLENIFPQALAGILIESFPIQGEFDDPCMILYTSGTTGAPKGAVLTNKMLYWNALSTNLRLEISRNDSTIIFHPQFHTSGWNVLTTPFLFQGAKVFLTKKFEQEKILNAIAEHKISVFFGVPTMLSMLQESPKFAQIDLSSLRFAVVGGEPMPLKLIEQWSNRGVAIRQGFGMTEFGPNIFSLNHQDASLKWGSIGFPNHFVDCKIVRADGQLAGPNETGELYVKGPAMMAGYWRNETATAQALEQGYFKTGDLLRRDSEGFYYVVGRSKDMYISGGENVYPAEVEQFLARLPGVKEAAVVGVKDNRWGEVGFAYMVRNAPISDEDVRTNCLGQLAKFKIPKYIKFVEELPKTDSGKIQKASLRSMAAAELSDL